ncbi:MAG: phospholipase D-like domain-containing protein, partial [Lactobacillaceae bacterium]|nr:phospholipase D-like domain-containing protein [Lactobacillaceae bacterium]
MSVQTFFYAMVFILLVNAILSTITVFWSKRDVSTIWAWLLVLILLPGLGFVIFWFFGRRISDKQIFDLTSQTLVNQELAKQRQKMSIKDITLDSRQQQIINLLQNTDDSFLSLGNLTQPFFEGEAFFEDLISEIKKARHSIHLEFFTIFDDQIGNEVVNILTEKALSGVEVRVVFDQFGSKGRHKKLYKKLVEAGGEVYPFLMRPFQLLTFRINFRLHRKIVVIDGKVGYIGGFNIGDMYLGKSKKFGHWRDTQLKLIGEAALS